MKILEISKNKKQYMELLFLADEQEDMIDKYINRGTMYILDDNGVKSECVVTDEGNGILEIKNIYHKFQLALNICYPDNLLQKPASQHLLNVKSHWFSLFQIY